ncbi:MAG: hypothetical protein NC131_14800 [Roseburia sp.]|nr:hypothetical protein [Roseburia sp.]
MNKDTEILKAPDTIETTAEKEFKGYSLEELRYQRALLALKKEFCKSKVIHNVNKIRSHTIFGTNKNGAKISKVGPVVSKLLNNLNYVDYALLGVSAFSTGKKIFSFFRGLRKK